MAPKGRFSHRRVVDVARDDSAPKLAVDVSDPAQSTLCLKFSYVCPEPVLVK